MFVQCKKFRKKLEDQVSQNAMWQEELADRDTLLENQCIENQFLESMSHATNSPTLSN